MYAATLVLFVALSVLINANQSLDNYPIEGNDVHLNATEGIKGWHFHANVKTTSTLHVEFTPVPLVFCFQEQYPVPVNSSFWQGSCSIFVNISNGTVPVKLRNVPYFLGLFFATPAQNEVATVHFTLGEPLDSCTLPGEIFEMNPLPGKCAVPETLTSGFHEVQMGENEIIYYHIAIPEMTPSFVICEEDMPGEEEAEYEETLSQTVIFDVRRSGAPSDENYDQKGSCLTFNFPRPGDYYVQANATSAGKKNITLEIEHPCAQDGKAGPGCATTYVNATNAMKQTMLEDYFYYKVIVNAANPLWVSVRSENGTNNPLIYASKGQLPQKDNADIQGCNQNYCDQVNSILVNISGLGDANETWFVSLKGVNGTQFGVWYSSICAPNCDDHGECEDSGVCDCVADFIGVDCSQTNGLGAQYIVLIIIASLVVASAVIGFIAWAYMRRKRVEYEHVS